MKKRHNLPAWILFIPFLLTGCYEDEGNYSYHEINELEVDSIADGYNIDMYDSLVIRPVLKGSLYSDTSRFTYRWEIGGFRVGESHDLTMEVKLQPGRKYSRYIVTDKNTGVRKYHEFYVNVSSSTAGDLILVLSKYQGKAELSYLRLDKPAEWQINSFEPHNGEALGTDPRQLSISYLESYGSFPFADSDGRIMVVTDNSIKLLYKNSLLLDTLSPILQKEAYLKLAVYPKPDIKEYSPRFVNNQIYIWRYIYGNTPQIQHLHMMISAGHLYTACLANSVWSPNYTFDEKSPYPNGYLAPFGYWDDMSDEIKPRNAGFEPGDFILFDEVKHRFATSGSYGGIHETKEEDVKAFPGYTLLWGTATNMEKNTSLAVLNNGDRCRFVLLENGKDADNYDVKKLAGEADCGSLLNARSKFYMMKYNEYLLFSAGSKVYRYNISNITGGGAPSEGNKVIDLQDYGYGSDAVITDLCVSRSEKTLLVGVSRYGADSEASGEEPKGDLLYFDLNKTTVGVTYNKDKSRRGIAGIPVDVEIKYQTHYRNGEDVQQGGKFMDKI